MTDLRLACNHCAVKMRGRLRPGLHRMQHLTILYLHNNELEGPLPVGWAAAVAAAVQGGSSGVHGACTPVPRACMLSCAAAARS